MLTTFGMGLALTGVAATLLPISRCTKWWVRVLDFPRMQILTLLMAGIACIAAGTFLGGAWPWSTGVAVVWSAAIASSLYQAWKIVPYSRLGRIQIAHEEPGERPVLRILISNVLQSNRRYSDLLNLIRQKNPDLVFAVECGRNWVERLNELKRDYPYTIEEPRDNGYGLALYSRLPFECPELRFLRDEEIPSVKVSVRMEGGRRVRCYGLHPAPPVPQYATETEQRDAEILMVAREVRETDEPALVFGDLNDVAWSPTTTLFQKVSGLLDPRVGRGQFSTFHAEWPGLRYPLDHIFVSSHFRLVKLECGPFIGSDHFPIYAEFCENPGNFQPAPEEEEKPEASPEDLAEAEERIEQANRKLDEETDVGTAATSS